MFLRKALAELCWQNYSQVPNYILGSPWRDWVLDRGSLTSRLTALSGGNFVVEVLRQSFSVPVNSERMVLNMKTRQACLIREVALHCHHRPVVYARSTIPLSTLRGQEKRLAHLGSRPLGAFLFQHTHMSRGPLEITGFRHLFGGENRVGWGRRSIFYLHDRPLLVSEFFLPALISLLKKEKENLVR